MARSRKVQVTLDESEYEALERMAARQRRKLASVVRESIVAYCVEPEARRRMADAVETLKSVSAPVPADYAEWEKEYGRLKGGPDSGKKSEPR